MNSESIVQFGKFATVGCLNTLIDWLVYFTILKIFPAESILFYAVAKGFSYFCGIINSFFLNRYWTFNVSRKQNEKTRFLKFTLVNALGLGINSTSLYVLLSYYNSHIVTLFLATAISFGFNFILSKSWVFRKGKMATGG